MSLEQDSRTKYSGSAYSAACITSSMLAHDRTFSGELLTIKHVLLSRYCAGKRVVDLGCADGRHLGEISNMIHSGIGIDFSIPFIERALESKQERLSFLVGDVRALPIKSRSVDCIFSFATLYYIDEIEKVYAEISRVLSANGVAILELGNSRSLATLVSRKFPDLARHSGRRIGDHLRVISRHGLRVKGWRSFQILPMWGNRPYWLQILRMPIVERLVMVSIRGRMIDEWISSSWLFRQFAFRHLVVLQKN